MDRNYDSSFVDARRVGGRVGADDEVDRWDSGSFSGAVYIALAVGHV